MPPIAAGLRRSEARTTPTAVLRRLPTNVHELTMSGRFRHPHWVATLLSSLSARRISVVSALASAPVWGHWQATFLLDGVSAEAESLDFVALAEAERRHGAHAAPSIGSYDVRKRTDGQIELDVGGPDQLGFLGGLLGELSMLMLFPSELVVDTVDGRIRDTLVLRGMGGHEPSDDARAALESLLSGLSAAP